MTLVYRLTTEMRFEDTMLISILRSIRTRGGRRLTDAQWQALKDTDGNYTDGRSRASFASSAADASAQFRDKGDWYQSSYSWTIVSMAQMVLMVSSIGGRHNIAK